MQAYKIDRDRAESRFFPPQVALYLVKIACELPDTEGRSLSQWDCTELARQVVVAGLVGSLSASTVRRILNNHHLKPWRHHLWLSPKVPRDKAFIKSIREISRLYTRKLQADEMVLCLDEKTSLQPRPRKAATLPPQPNSTMKVEHEYERKGALNLFAAFDTRRGKVWGQTHERKRQRRTQPGGCLILLHTPELTITQKRPANIKWSFNQWRIRQTVASLMPQLQPIWK